MVRWRSGIPLEKSIRGNARGGRASVTSRFTSGMANAEVLMTRRNAKNQTRQSPGSNLPNAESTTAVETNVSTGWAKVQEQADMPARPVDPGFQRQPAADRTLQALSSMIDQVVADMRATVMLASLCCSSLRVNNSFACYGHFAACAVSRHVLDDMR